MTDCSRAGAGQGDGSGARYEQIVFSFGEDVTPTLRFDAAAVTADAGLAPLRELDERLGLTALAATFVDDHARQVRRDPGPNGAEALAPRRGAPGPTAASSRMSRGASPTNDWPLYLSGMPAGALVPRLPPPPSSHSFEGKVCHNDKVCAGVACPNDNPAPGTPRRGRSTDMHAADMPVAYTASRDREGCGVMHPPWAGIRPTSAAPSAAGPKQARGMLHGDEVVPRD